MDEQVNRLVTKVSARLQRTPPERRLLIGIAGIPGSGKTTLSKIIVSSLNTLAAQDPSSSAPPPPTGGDVAVCVPMDGFHLTRAQLSAMPDPQTAHARRGAEFTFDGAAFLGLVTSLREQEPLSDAKEIQTMYAPSFDHAVKDPKPNDIEIRREHRVVVFEGNYLALDKSPWKEAAALMDELWFVDVPFPLARTRLAARHVASGIVPDLDAGFRRADDNDLVNGEEIVRLRLPVHEVITSREDGKWVHT
ncbi:putative uridine kinase [Diplogelasinospora grovesii]|uniref:Uridine kinase n=1 Tax=Diplogelasinospora grovesii TaxID=303347 RepID=A0AAN6NAQ7_9PEZI|nr:putative uridine kinase [Diplogelasinospora grovesii]